MIQIRPYQWNWSYSCPRKGAHFLIKVIISLRQTMITEYSEPTGTRSCFINPSLPCPASFCTQAPPIAWWIMRSSSRPHELLGPGFCSLTSAHYGARVCFALQGEILVKLVAKAPPGPSFSYLVRSNINALLPQLYRFQQHCRAVETPNFHEPL